MALLASTSMAKFSPKLSCNGGQSIKLSPETRICLRTGFSERRRKNHGNRIPIVRLAVENHSGSLTSAKFNGKRPTRRKENPILSEGRDDDEKYGPVCPGCGVFMQDKDPNLPGYFKRRKDSEVKLVEDVYMMQEYLGNEAGGFDGEEEDEFEGSDSEEGDIGEGDEFDWESDEWEAKLVKGEDETGLDGFAPAGVGYGNNTEETIENRKKKRLSKTERKQILREAKKDQEEVTVCARCHSLRNYGQVKNESAENLIPDFDFDKVIATRFTKPTGNANATVVVLVVDCVDFDGSFPKRAAKSLFKMLKGPENDPKLMKKCPKLVLVATKVDLLPSQISPTRLDRWVRHRAKAGGAPKLNGVHLVSAHKDLGVRDLLSCIKDLAGPRGNVWVVGAQNAGKSTLINAFAKKQGAKVTRLTEAPVPGTTLGILRIGGVLPAKAKMYDTPGLLHPYLMSLRLNRDEQKMVEIRKELKPRTYRMKVGQAVHVGGLVRLELNEASVETIYITVWASPNVSLHMGKIENADDIWKNHIGFRLQPPIGAERAYELGKWEARKIKVSGTSWDVNSTDFAVAGLGWFSLGLKGEATLTLWTYDGIEMTSREPLVLDRARFIERPGFWLPKAISDAVGLQSKMDAEKREKHQEETPESFVQVSG